MGTPGSWVAKPDRRGIIRDKVSLDFISAVSSMLAMMGASQEPQMKRPMCLSVRCRQGRDLIFNLRSPNTMKSLYIGYETCAHEYYQKVTANLQKYTKKEDFLQELKFFEESLQKLGMEMTRMIVFREGLEDCLQIFSPPDKIRRKFKKPRDHSHRISSELSSFLDSTVDYCAEGSLSSHQVINSLRCFGMQHYVNLKAKQEKLHGKLRSPLSHAHSKERVVDDAVAEESSHKKDEENPSIPVSEEVCLAHESSGVTVKLEERLETTARVPHRKLRSSI